MFRKALLVVIPLILTSQVQAQVPEAINYQAVVRDGNGDLMMNQQVDVTFIIRSSSASGTIVLEEEHNAVTTNPFGLVSLQIGTGTTVTGSLVAIDFTSDSHWLEVEVDGNSVGTQQLVTVPYALLARDVENDAVEDADADATNELQFLSINNDTVFLTNGGFVKLPPPSTDADWQTSGNYVYNLSDSVGIGTSAPTDRLDVIGRLGVDSLLIRDPPGFSAYQDGILILGNGQTKTIKPLGIQTPGFDNAGLNLATGVFSVPRNGYYHCSYSAVVHGIENERGETWLLVNGSQVQGWNTIFELTVVSASVAQKEAVSKSGVLKLQAGDQVQVQASLFSLGMVAVDSGNFSIFLLSDY